MINTNVTKRERESRWNLELIRLIGEHYNFFCFVRMWMYFNYFVQLFIHSIWKERFPTTLIENCESFSLQFEQVDLRVLSSQSFGFNFLNWKNRWSNDALSSCFFLLSSLQMPIKWNRRVVWYQKRKKKYIKRVKIRISL